MGEPPGILFFGLVDDVFPIFKLINKVSHVGFSLKKKLSHEGLAVKNIFFQKERSREYKKSIHNMTLTRATPLI